jgi:hypothetical protein
VDRHRFVADPDQDEDLTFNFDANPEQNPIPSFTHVGESRKSFYSSLRAVPVALFYQYSLALHLVETDTDPDSKTMLIRLDPDTQHYVKTSFTAVTR